MGLESFRGEFEQSINKLLLHPCTWLAVARKGRRRYLMKAIALISELSVSFV